MKFLHIENDSLNQIINLDTALSIKIVDSSNDSLHICIIPVIDTNSSKSNIYFDLSKPQLDELLSFLKNKDTYFKCPTL